MNIFKILSQLITIDLRVMFTAALPIIELRGAIPLGIALGLSSLHATLISFIGSLIPVPFILFGIRPFLNRIRDNSLLSNVVIKITNRTMNKSSNIQKYGFWGLILFIAIPLPGTGIWTGTLAAALLDLRFKIAFPSIVIGNMIAAILVFFLSNGFVEFLSIL